MKTAPLIIKGIIFYASLIFIVLYLTSIVEIFSMSIIYANVMTLYVVIIIYINNKMLDRDEVKLFIGYKLFNKK